MSQTTEQVMQQAEIAIANLVSYQSSGTTPTIHEYGHANRTLEQIRAALRTHIESAGAGGVGPMMPAAHPRPTWSWDKEQDTYVLDPPDQLVRTPTSQSADAGKLKKWPEQIGALK